MIHCYTLIFTFRRFVKNVYQQAPASISQPWPMISKKIYLVQKSFIMILTHINQIADILKQLIILTFNQFIWVFSLLLIFGFILYLFARFTRITFVKSVGRMADIILTGWIGTPVHEIGHALFCLIFRHKIIDIKLYSPSSEDGTLGYVRHSFDSKSIYQNIGNFFIGIGPILLGSALIYLLMVLLTRLSQNTLFELQIRNFTLIDSLRGNSSEIINSTWESIKLVVSAVFRVENFTDYKFWIFIYLSLCISSHMELSPWDIKGAWKGLLWIILFMFIVNALVLGIESSGFIGSSSTWSIFLKLGTYQKSINNALSLSGAILFFASVVSGLNFLLTYTVFNIYNLLRSRGLINPIW